MTNEPPRPARSHAPHFLLTNDDGIEAEGLNALRSAAAALGASVTVVAPAEEYSMCGHRVTTYTPIKVESRRCDQYAVHGTPADCVRIGLYALHLRPDWILSGINHGGNMGQDVYISGTVAAAREATYHGFKAMVFSHYVRKGLEFDWSRASNWVRQIIQRLMPERLAEDCLWNVNLPHLPAGPVELPELVHCRLARSPLNVSFEFNGADEYRYTARYPERPQDSGSDVEACFGGRVAVSQVSL